MAAIIGFLFFIITAVLRLFVIALIINAVLSWLVAFDVVNYRNRLVASLQEVLDRVVSPVLEPLRRVIPTMSGVDLTPIVAIIVIQGIIIYLLPASQRALLSLVPY